MAILQDEAAHFLFSAGAGFAVFYLTSTILSMLCKKAYPSGTPSAISRATIYIPLLLSLCVALYVHCLLDGLVVWYTTPLNPPLEIRK